MAQLCSQLEIKTHDVRGGLVSGNSKLAGDTVAYSPDMVREVESGARADMSFDR